MKIITDKTTCVNEMVPKVITSVFHSLFYMNDEMAFNITRLVQQFVDLL